MATKLGKKEEREFQSRDKDVVEKHEISKNSDYFKHFYDFREFYKDYVAKKDKGGKHFPLIGNY